MHELVKAYQKGLILKLLPYDVWSQEWFKRMVEACVSANCSRALYTAQYRWCHVGLPKPMLQVYYPDKALLCDSEFLSERIQFSEFVRRMTGVGLIIVAGSDGLWRIAFQEVDALHQKWIFEPLYGAPQTYDHC